MFRNIFLKYFFQLNIHVDTNCLKGINIDWAVICEFKNKQKNIFQPQNGWNFGCFIMLKIIINICCIVIGKTVEM